MQDKDIELMKSALLAIKDLPFSSIPSSPEVAVLTDMLLLRGVLIEPEGKDRKRQGKRGTRGASNFMKRKAVWFARLFLNKAC